MLDSSDKAPNKNMPIRGLLDRQAQEGEEKTWTGVVLEKADELYDAINTDSLTGLSNLSGLERGLRAIAEAGKGNYSRVAIVFIDLDKFKGINDMYGYNAGDETLKKVADTLKRLFKRKDDILSETSRWGGDEFVLAIPYEDTNDGEDRRTSQDVVNDIELAISTRLNDALSSEELPDYMVGMTATVGASVHNMEELKGDLNDLLQSSKDKVQTRKKERPSR